MQIVATEKSDKRLSDPDCLRSFFLASHAHKIITKREVLMASRLLSAALHRNSGFKMFLYNLDPELLERARHLSRHSNASRLMHKFTLTDNDYNLFRTSTLSCFQDLLPFAEKYDAEHAHLVPIKEIIRTGIDFMRAENAAHEGKNEFGVSSPNHINPFIVINASAEVLCELMKSVYDDQFEGVERNDYLVKINKYTSLLHEKYPAGLTVMDSTLRQRRDVLDDICTMYDVIQSQLEDFPVLDPRLQGSVKTGLAMVGQYLEPFTCEIPQPYYSVADEAFFASNVISYPFSKKPSRSDPEGPRGNGPDCIL